MDPEQEVIDVPLKKYAIRDSRSILLLILGKQPLSSHEIKNRCLRGIGVFNFFTKEPTILKLYARINPYNPTLS
jgi:hypothetical protein